MSLDAATIASAATTQATTGDPILGLLGKDHSSSSITAPIATASGTASASAGGGGSGGGSSRHQSGNNSNVSSGGQDISIASTSNGGTAATGGGSGNSAALTNNDRGGFPSDTSGGVSEEADSEGELEEDRVRIFIRI